MSNALINDRDRFSANHSEERYIVNGRDWGGLRIGENGPALVLIPGTLGRSDIFWQQIEALKGRARILSLSYPESGGVKVWGEDIANLIKRFELEGAVILGSSLGGYMAQYVAGTYPELVSGIVAANTLSDTTGMEERMPYALDLMNVPIDQLRKGFTAGLSQWCDGISPYQSLAELLLLEVNGRIPEMEMRARLNALKTAPPLPDQTLPTKARFSIESEDDHLIFEDMRERVRKTVKPSRSFIFKEASHFPYVTRPQEYTRILEEVLELKSENPFEQEGTEVHL
ncbi:MAG: alpha/beta hydrolase [Sneathiellales bacterium]|nr:alpha/beta hydrolase [Sneathiellales bacterium]